MRALRLRRKTGVTLKDTGVRDEYGMQPIDDIFSSPEKGGNDSDDGEADMDLTTGKHKDNNKCCRANIALNSSC